MATNSKPILPFDLESPSGATASQDTDLRAHFESLTADDAEAVQEDTISVEVRDDSIAFDPTMMVAPEATGLISKLAKILGAIGWIPKRGKNTFHNYDYVMEADLVDSVRHMLAEANIFVLMDVESVRSLGPIGSKGEVLWEVRTQHIFLDGDSGKSLIVRSVGHGSDKGDKAVYKAMTGAMKYFLMKNFLVATGNDPEQDSPGAQSETRNTRAQNQGRPPQQQRQLDAETVAKASQFVREKIAEAAGAKASDRAVLSAILRAATNGRYPNVTSMPPTDVVGLADEIRAGRVSLEVQS